MRFRGLVFSALFAALFAVLSLVSIHVNVVPITLETLVVMISGALLGPWYGALTYVIVIGLDLLGLPLIGGSGGIGLLVGPTAGFIWGWPFCAFFGGLAVRKIPVRHKREHLLLFLALFVLGDLLCYIPGVLWVCPVVPQYHPWGKAIMAGMVPFLPGDFIKAVIATVIVARVRRVYSTDRILYGERAATGTLTKTNA